MMRAPGDEYDAFYATYAGVVPDDDVLASLRAAPDQLERVLAGITGEHERFAYAAGKWSIREVVGHVIDTERVFGYRALHFARGDTSELPGMEQDDWAAASNAAERALAGLLREFRDLRAANTTFFASLDDAVLARAGFASGVSFTVRALATIMAGHEIHHRRVLRERYVTALGCG